MKTLHLFAGAGGGLLADLILGHTPIGAVEIDPYCCQVLREKADAGWWPELRVHEIDIRDFDPSEYANRVDCVSGGFPCQDISAAGRGEGITGERSGLWSEYVRILRVLRPAYAFIENSPMLTLRGLDVVLSDLAALGFDAEWQVVSAADVGAPHIRYRIWILAHTKSKRQRKPADEANTVTTGWEAWQKLMRGSECADVANAYRYGVEKRLREDRKPGRGEVSKSWMEADRGRQSLANARSGRLRGSSKRETELTRRAEVIRASEAISDSDSLRQLQPQGRKQEQRGRPGDGNWWQFEPDVGRVAHGVANRVDRLKALGNGQVPLQAAVAWKALMAQAQRQPDLFHMGVGA